MPKRLHPTQNTESESLSLARVAAFDLKQE